VPKKFWILFYQLLKKEPAMCGSLYKGYMMQQFMSKWSSWTHFKEEADAVYTGMHTILPVIHTVWNVGGATECQHSASWNKQTTRRSDVSFHEIFIICYSWRVAFIMNISTLSSRKIFSHSTSPVQCCKFIKFRNKINHQGRNMKALNWTLQSIRLWKCYFEVYSHKKESTHI
jgi:hypothetical protein